MSFYNKAKPHFNHTALPSKKKKGSQTLDIKFNAKLLLAACKIPTKTSSEQKQYIFLGYKGFCR